MRYLILALLLVLIGGVFQLAPVWAVARAVSGEAQYEPLIMPKPSTDKIQKALLMKKIKAKKAEIIALDVSIAYVSGKIELAQKAGKSTVILDKKLKTLQASKKLHEVALTLLEKKLAGL
jgi:hypothetical protein